MQRVAACVNCLYVAVSFFSSFKVANSASVVLHCVAVYCSVLQKIDWRTSMIHWIIRRKTRSYMWHDSFVKVTWLIHICDMTHPYMWYNSFIYVTRLVYQWLIHIDNCNTLQHTATHCNTLQHTATHCNTSQDSYINYSFIYVTRLVHICDMTHSYRWDSFMYVIWLVQICDMIHWYMWHDSFISATWLAYMCDMTASSIRHTIFLCVTLPILCVSLLITQ